MADDNMTDPDNGNLYKDYIEQIDVLKSEINKLREQNREMLARMSVGGQDGADKGNDGDDGEPETIEQIFDGETDRVIKEYYERKTEKNRCSLMNPFKPLILLMNYGN